MDAGERGKTNGWAHARQLSLVDAAAMLWAERKLALGVAALVCVLGLAIALLAPRTYPARAELLVRLGQEYVYQPAAGVAGAGAAPDMQAVVNAEMRMIGSAAVVRRVIGEVGLARLYPRIAAGGGSDARKLADAERAFIEHLRIETAPQTPAITIAFAHANPETAARTLNVLIEQYLAYRRLVLTGGGQDALVEQSAEINERAADASIAIAAFLAANEISDFESELAALAQRAADTETQLLESAARRGEAEARAGALRVRYEGEPEEIALYSESDARRELVAAQVEREELLSRYQDDSPPVREVDRRITQLNAFLAGGDPASVTRRGANPVRQDVASQLFAVEAEARAQRGREAALNGQREEVRARLVRMRELEPEYRRLARERAILETNAQNYAERAEGARAYSELLGRSTDNISEVERASIPTQAQGLRWPIAIIALLLAMIAGAAAGLVRALMRRGFPTPAAAARALDTPVLAVAPFAPAVKAARVAPDLKVVEGAKP